MKRRILIYSIGKYGLMAEDQSFRRAYFFSLRKKWWNVSGVCSVGFSHIEMEIRIHDVRDWVFERVQEYKDKNIQIDIVNKSIYDIF